MRKDVMDVLVFNLSHKILTYFVSRVNILMNILNIIIDFIETIGV